MKVKTLLNKESKWVKNVYEEQGRYCLLGALQECYGGSAGHPPLGNAGEAYRDAKKKVESAIKEFATLRRVRVAKKPDIVRFNDNKNITFKDIRKVIRAANV